MLYRKDALRRLTSLKDVQVRVLQYFNAGNQKHVVDPTPDKKCLLKKAASLGKIFIPNNSKIDLPQVPTGFKNELTDFTMTDGWYKSLLGIPKFSVHQIEKHAMKINEIVTPKSTIVKKHFNRGEQLLEEKYIDIGSIRQHKLCAWCNT